METPAIKKIKAQFIGERILKADKEEMKKELYYIECNPEVAHYLCNVKKKLAGEKIPNTQNSMVMWAMGITDDMPKGGGISKTPTTLPDIDYDTDGRDEVKQYLVKKYGADHVTLLGTYNTLKTKGAVKDVIRQLRPQMEFEEVNNLTKKFDNVKRTDTDKIKEILTSVQGKDYDTQVAGNYSSEIAYYYACLEADPGLLQWFDANSDIGEAVKDILGNAKSTGIHAGGIVVSSANVPQMIPLSYSSDDAMWVTQPEMAYVEESGLVKYDFLGLKTLRDLNLCMKLIKERHGKSLKFSDIPLNDKKVFAEFTKGNTVSVFQFNTDLSVSILTKLKSVDSINDLSIITSIARPGPLTMGMDENFIKRKNGEEPIVYMHPLLESILSETYGITCIAEGSKILTKKGQVNIEDVKVGDLVKTENGSWQKVLANWYKGEKQTIRIRTSNGEELVCTKDHKILTQDGWKEAGKLTKKDIIKSFWVEKEKTKIGNDRDWLIGLAIADGDLNESSIRIACSDEAFAKKVSLIAKKAFGLKNAHVKKNGRSWYAVMSMKKGFNGYYSSNFKLNPFKEEIVKLGLFGKNSYTKFLPKNFTLSTIAGFIEGDGSVINHKIRVKNKELAYGVYKALQSYKIPSSFFKEEEGVFAVSFNDHEGKIPFRIKKYNVPEVSMVMVPRSYLKDIKVPNRRKDNRLYNNLKYKTPHVSIDIVKRLKVKIPHEHWSKILSIKEDAIHKVYDLSIENVHSFVTGGLVTHNCFQEQVMKVVQSMGGLSGDESVTVLKAMGKKQRDKLVKFKEKFIKNAVQKHKLSEKLAEEIWTYLEAFAEYGFNKSHAIAYSCVSYLCMWFKEYYAAEWIAAVLSGADKEDFKIYYQFWKDMIKPPHINLSKSQYLITEEGGVNKVTMPFSAINGLGDKVVEAIIATQPYNSFEDFFKRVDKRKVTKAAMINLIFAGTFDFLKPNVHYSENKWRKELLIELMKLRETIKKPTKAEKEEQEKFVEEVKNMTRGQMMMKEISLLNFTSFDYHKYYKDQMTEGAKKVFGSEAIRPQDVADLPNNKVVVVGGAVESILFFPIKQGKNKGKEMARITLTNEGGKCEIVVFPKTIEMSDKSGGKIRKIKEYTPLVVKGKVNHWNGNVSVIYDEGWILA